MKPKIRSSLIRKDDAEANDYYATEPKAVELLLREEKFDQKIFEPACGEGHISEVLKAHGYRVCSSDLIDRGYGEVRDFFDYEQIEEGVDIITNPPYKYAKEFVEHALKISAEGTKIAMLLRLTFLEGQKRRELFRNTPPQTVYVSPERLQCAKNGKFEGKSMVAYAWFIWRKGHYGPTNIKWFN